MPNSISAWHRQWSAAAIVRYRLALIFGLLCVALGGAWFVAGKGAILGGFPASTAEALACAAGGIAVALWAACRLKRAHIDKKSR